MGIYRGAGGTGDAVADSSSEALLVRNLAVEVQADADAAAASAAAALVSQTSAATSATNSASSATSAASSASTASTQATNASNSASAASTSATNAATSATAAQTAETNAETAETNANASASLAQDWATKTTGPVAGGEYSSKYNAQQSASSASAASSSASGASTSATNASNSASAAATSATNAGNSATAAAGSATSAASSATSASTSASNAATSETNAASSATTATTQAGIATTQATNAASSASAASTSATNAASSATAAAGSATSASTQATNAANSASAAATSETNAAASYDSFDDRYLGPKSVAPTLDNDGNTLLTGALYFNTVDNAMKVWSGSAWLDAYASLSGALLATNNLSDLTNKATARTNLGVAIGTNVQAWDADLDTWATKTAPTGTVVGTSDSQTLTNKTLTTPVINGFTGGTSVINIGSGQIYKDSSGNVGIGTTSPQMPLDLSGVVLSNANSTAPTVYGLRANLHNSFAMDANNPVSDLNNVRSLGVRSYFVSGTSANAPASYGSAFAYEHYVGASGVGSKYITQFAVTHNTVPTLYYRNSDTSNGSTFSNWYSVNLTSVSDIRAKKNIVDAPSQLDVLAQLEVKQFEYINENDAGIQIGMIAQQVDSVDPYYVTKDLENNNVLWRVHYDKMIPMLVKAVQELKAEFDAYKATHP